MESLGKNSAWRGVWRLVGSSWDHGFWEHGAGDAEWHASD